MNIVFRCDSSSKIGIGHVMRSLALAGEYSKSNIIFATKNLLGNINHTILKYGYKVEILKSNKLSDFILITDKYKANMVVIDSYDIDYLFEKKLKQNRKKLAILSLDDTYKKHHCDILLNPNLGADKKKYKQLVPKSCEIRCGIKYALIRDEFKIERDKKTIFLSMGGTDIDNINLKILKILKKFKNIDVILATTSSNKNIKQLTSFIDKHKYVKLYVDSNKLAVLMKNSDFAIVTPSVIVNEVTV
jgi:UDP-2,4-diacetamido-2,4,6-trideoxy-beta-L-altropyranose hydrolase